jgi:hypothetical protein
MLRGRFIPLMCDLWTEAKALEGRAPLSVVKLAHII